MSLEPGGRADKYGNQYENRYLAKLLLRLVDEKISSIIVEPLGDNSDSVEFVALLPDGTKEYYQCKASNAANSKWNLSDLNKYDIFKRSQKIILTDNVSKYFFISPLPYGELAELCKRARTNSSAKEFAEYQLTSESINVLFRDCAKYYDLDISTDDGLSKIVYILSHSYFETSPEGICAERDLDERTSIFFAGNASAARVLLEQYATTANKFGVPITANDVIAHMEEAGHPVRNYNFDERILQRIKTLNEVYWGSYHPINNSLFHRNESDIIFDKLVNGQSVILHGKAGTGKSGCVQEVIDRLNSTNTLYLSIKLDKYIPDISADEYGRKLDLPESPVVCLHTMAAGSPCVLILDQLDSLRWTCKHAVNALDVCKEIIAQVEAYKKHEDANIAILFVTRTFDLDNDPGLKNLFLSGDNNNPSTWDKVRIDNLSELETKSVVGKQYDSLSVRLKFLLRNPFCLYVWTKLEPVQRNNGISSLYQLINTWWSQVLESCITNELAKNDVVNCKNSIVRKMNENLVFSLPLHLFNDDKDCIDYLISSGVMISDGYKLSFLHQSILDYFLIGDMLNDIYSGKHVVDIVGGKSLQTPNVRYRLVTLLQNLLDSDVKKFISECKIILLSNDIRFYFKCVIFEIIGQQESPSKDCLDLAFEYLNYAEWHDFLNRSVYMGHAPFVEHLICKTGMLWDNEEYLSLASSINDKDPDFVVDIIEPYCFSNEENNYKAYMTLCTNPEDDSEKMFEFRLRLLSVQPSLLKHFYGFHKLINNCAERAIQILKLVIIHSESVSLNNLYFGNDAGLKGFAESQYELVIDELFPVLCKVTSKFNTPKSRYRFNECYEKWTKQDYDQTTERTVVELLKYAFSTSARTNPQKTIRIISKVGTCQSVIGHEIIMSAIENLSSDYADFSIDWIVSDFKNRVFVYSEDGRDYLGCSKRIIKKYSAYCSEAIFRQLECEICNWKDSTDRMILYFNQRKKVNSTHEHPPVYYAYWGNFQKELLPLLDNARTTKRTKELLAVLNRNEWIQDKNYNCGFWGGACKTVVSPVEKYADRLSDKTWLEIISTPAEKMGQHWHGKETAESYVEATHDSFSSSFERQAKKNPERFAKLSMQFPEKCYPGYVNSVIRALQERVNGVYADLSITCDVIRYFCCWENSNTAIETARLIEHRAAEEWPADVISILSDIAITHSHPAKDEFAVVSRDDPESLSVNSLMTNSINCARGCAAHSIANLIWAHADLVDYFKPVIVELTNDPNDAVRFGLVSCVIAVYNSDAEFSAKVFKNLLSQDIRIVGHHNSWDIICRDFSNNKDLYKQALLDACKSTIADLSEIAARLVCAVAVFFGEEDMLEFIEKYPFSINQKNAICHQAVSTYNRDEYHGVSEMIIRYLIDDSTEELNGLTCLFTEKKIVINRDSEFLAYIMQSQQGTRLVHSFLEYLTKCDDDISQYADVLYAVGMNLSSYNTEWSSYFITDDLIQCVNHLFERNQDEERIRNICLDVWDNLFKSNLRNHKPLSEMIDCVN